MGTIKATNIEPIADNGTVTLGSSGDTFTVPSGVTVNMSSATQTGVGGVMTPAFSVYLSSTQDISGSGTMTRCNFNTELLDTDNAYDNSSNYRFTPQTAGKYALFATIRGFTGSGDYNAYSIQLRKNNTAIGRSDLNMSSNVLGGGANVTIPISIVADANGSSDYFDVYFSANNSTFKAEAGTATNFFGYKIIGA